MIRQSADDGKPKRRLMPTEMALSIIGQAAEIGVPALKFNWRGESTIHPDYTLILCTAGGYGYDKDGNLLKCNDWSKTPWGSWFHELLVNTNANCKDHAIHGLMAATKVMVSLDSCEPETYKKMRVGGSLERAIEVTKELLRRGHKNVWVRRVITKDNEREPFFQRCREIFGEGVRVSQHYCFDRNQTESHKVGCDHDSPERVYCNYPSQRIVISSTGLCYPCCIDLKEEMPIGDIKKQSLLEIWNSEKMRKLRSDLRNNVFLSEACKNCQSWMSYKSPKRGHVQDIEVKK